MALATRGSRSALTFPGGDLNCMVSRRLDNGSGSRTILSSGSENKSGGRKVGPESVISTRVADLQLLDAVECLGSEVKSSFLVMSQRRPGSGEKLEG